MEAQMQEMVNEMAGLMQTVQQQAQVIAQLQAGQTKGAGKGDSARLGIDVKRLGQPDKFDGSDAKFRDWCIVFKSYVTVGNSEMGALLREAELGTARRNAEMSDSERVASTELYHFLISLCTQTAFEKVVNSGDGEGTLAWKAIIDRWDPKMRTRQAGILLGVLKWSFAGDILGRMESFERECLRY